MALEDYLTPATAVAALFAVVVLNGIFNALTSPFPSSIPGPFLARFTSLWILLVDLSGHRAATVDALHKKHGPVVRLAPNELSFAGKEAVKTIYGSNSTCIKSPVYDNLGRRGMFHIQDPEQHRQRQRRVSHIFSAGTLQQMEPLVQNVVNRTISAIARTTANQTTDALRLSRLMALDVAGEVLMGKPFGAFGDGDDDGSQQADDYLQNIDNTFLAFAIEGLSPAFHHVLSLLPVPSLQNLLAAPSYFYSYGAEALSQYVSLNGRNSARRNLLTKLLAGNPEKGIDPLPDEQIGIEISNLTFAAVDTTSTTVTYCLYQLACHPDWQRKVREEVLASDAKETMFSYAKTVQHLPILDAVLQETLRMHPVVPGGLPRMTTSTETLIEGVTLPPKMMVSVQGYTVQRDPTVFADQDRFHPTRWIEADKETLAEMREMMLVWGGKGGAASRMCPGQYMATMEMKLLLARVVAEFEVRLAAEETHAEMEMMAHFALIAKGGRCGLVFEPLG